MHGPSKGVGIGATGSGSLQELVYLNDARYLKLLEISREECAKCPAFLACRHSFAICGEACNCQIARA